MYNKTTENVVVMKIVLSGRRWADRDTYIINNIMVHD